MQPQITLDEITIYPVKSTQGIAISSTLIDKNGLMFDREFVITDLYGKFITGRSKAKLVLVNASFFDDVLILSAPGMPTLSVNKPEFSKTYKTIQVWNDNINAQHCSADIDLWFSEYLNTQCQCFYFGSQSKRTVKNSDSSLMFADGYPLMGISKGSLANLNSKLHKPINMAQFRPNLVFSSSVPFCEDEWSKIKIGDIIFEVSKPCSRCIFTTVNEATATRSPIKEPMATLSAYRKHTNGEVYFGQNLIPLNQGILNVGDPVDILEYQPSILAK